MHLPLRHRILVVFLAALPVTGCTFLKKLYKPHEAAAEESDRRNRAEVAAYPDGDCPTAETCKYRCETLERALDCYKTGKAALGGVDVHYEGGWRADKVSGSTDDYRVSYEEDSQEHVSLMPLARESFERACNANHAESCRLSGDLIVEHNPEVGATFYRKACALKDEPACAKLAGTR
jgi:hypothetical protein